MLIISLNAKGEVFFSQLTVDLDCSKGVALWSLRSDISFLQEIAIVLKIQVNKILENAVTMITLF
jgi:hypothetical protein